MHILQQFAYNTTKNMNICKNRIKNVKNAYEYVKMQQCANNNADIFGGCVCQSRHVQGLRHKNANTRRAQNLEQKQCRLVQFALPLAPKKSVNRPTRRGHSTP